MPSMRMYCVVMSDVKQESLATSAKVRISTQQHCMYEGPEEIYGKSTQGT